MEQLERRDKILIEPVYMQSEINEAIRLGKERVAIQSGTERCTGVSDVSMQFVPTAELVFDTVPQDAAAISLLQRIMFPNRVSELQLTDRGVKFEASQRTLARFSPNCSVVNATAKAEGIQRTVFHLFNFPSFISSTDYWFAADGPESGKKQWVRCGRVTLLAGGWAITISATAQSWTDDRLLRDYGGWLITHVGEIVRLDNSSYTSEAVIDLLKCLSFFLSFAVGRWTGLALPVGFGTDNSRVFEQWGMPTAAAGHWKGSSSWFDDRHGDFLPSAFPGFWEIWNQNLWNGPVQEAIYWYLGASDRGVGIGVDTGLIIAQTALELLAWNYCVRDRKMVSEGAFEPRGLSAADRFRLLASALNIPLAIPQQLRSLHGKRGRKWTDSMDALTAVRNSIVHPGEHEEIPDGADYDAWRLSMWFIDLVLLRLCGYDGSYANRLTPQRFAGVVEQVPWAKGIPPK